jgi:UDP-GlcNAc:undecaprenyl-phosphate GlcNAc-1-phosphate transferase
MKSDFVNYLSQNILMYGVLAQLVGSILSLYFVPTIRKLALAKSFTDSPSKRKSHTTETPILGGVGVYMACLLTIYLFTLVFQDIISLNDFSILGPATLILLFVGIVDDILGLKPTLKLVIQLIVSSFVIYTGSFFVNSMGGLFGVFEISLLFSFLLSLFIFIVFINMFNLIDGIDGLASVISVFGFIFFAYFAFITSNYFSMLVSMTSIGCLLPFMYFNIFSKNKIFLGDSGSLVLGIILGYLTLDVLSSTHNEHGLFFKENIIIILMCVFSYPLVDTLRVFTIRILRNKNPLSADRNHIHHHLLRLGFSHRKATLAIFLNTALLTGLSYLLKDLNINIAFSLLIILAFFTVCLPSFFVKNPEGVIHLKRKLKA